MKRGKLYLFLFFFIFALTTCFSKSLTEELRELYIKRSKGLISQAELERRREELTSKASKPPSPDTVKKPFYQKPEEPLKKGNVVQEPFTKEESRFDSSSFKSKAEQAEFNRLIEAGNFERAIQIAVSGSKAYNLALGFINLKSKYFSKNNLKRPTESLNKVTIIIFASKYWKAKEMVQMSQDMQLSVNGSSYYGETIDKDDIDFAFVTKKFDLFLPDGTHDFVVNYPVNRRRAYDNSFHSVGKWCLKNCEFKFSMGIHGSVKEVRVIDFYRKAISMDTYVVGEKFLSSSEYDSLLKRRSEQEKQERNLQAFASALAIASVAASPRQDHGLIALQQPSINASFVNSQPVNFSNFQPENSPFNPKNSSFNPENSQYNPKNSSFNPNNSIYNPKNSSFNPQNSRFNPKNSPFNPSNNQFNPRRNAILDLNGRSIGYFTNKAGGGYNLFDNQGQRIGYTNANSRGLFDSAGKNIGHVVPGNDGCLNLFLR